MAFKSQPGIRLALEICLEVAGEAAKSLLLAGKQAAVWILNRGPCCRKINAVDGKPFFDGHDFWTRSRRWRCLHLHGGCGRSRKRRIAVIADVARDGDCARLSPSAVQGSGRVVAGNVACAGGVTISQWTAVRAAGDGTDSGSAPVRHASMIWRTGNNGRIGRFYGELCVAGSHAVFAAVAQAGSNFV